MKKRLAAEWEPTVGVMVAWPATLPQDLIRKLVKDTTVYFLCADDEGIADAKETLVKMGADSKDSRFLIVPKGDDATWPRDWGPHPIFDELGNYELMGPRYRFSTPYCDMGHDPKLYCAPWGEEEKIPLTQFEGNTVDDLSSEAIARQLNLPFIKAPYVFTGGNALNDGVNTVFSCEVILAENKFEGLTQDMFYKYVTHITGMTNYTILSDYENFSLNHVDAFLKILDERRLLVLRPPKDHELYPICKDIVDNELRRAVNSYGEPWEIIPLDTGMVRSGEGLALYPNALILNTHIYVPMYGIPEDDRALQEWRDAMPGYDVQGFTFELKDEPFISDPGNLDGEVGWRWDDCLHCRTRAVWDPHMLHVDVPGPAGVPTAGKPVSINARVVAYSGKPLINDKCKVFWRVTGSGKWNEVALIAGPIHEMLVAEIPAQPAGTTIEYYVQAADESGRQECSPRVAPKQYLTYMVR